MAQPTSDRLKFADTAEALNLLMLDTEEKTNNPSMLNAQDQVIIDPRRDNVDQPGSLNAVGYHHSGCLSDAYFSQAQSVYNGGGYDNATSKGVTCLPYANAESLKNGSHCIQDESPSVALHGYGYNPQMLHRPYITTQLPSVRGHGHLYHAQQFSASDPSCFQQPISPKKPCILSSTSVSQGKLPAHIDLQGDSKRFGLKPNYAPSLGSTSKGGDFLGNSDGLDFFHQGSEGCEVGGLWSNWSKPLNGKSSLLQLSSAAASLTPIRSLEFSRDDFEMASQWKGSFFGFGSCTGSRYRGYSHCLSDQGSEYGCVSTSSMEMDGQNWPSLTEARQGGRCNNFSCSCTVTLDTLSERNRGPRAFKPKVRTTAYGFAVDNSKNGTVDDILKGSYNQLDFVTNYKVAKFFIIKSYSEDNVHKSIKYGLWASTPNGNKKLDAASREAKEKHGTCPIFLLFSVNASAQFCGVAEMVGPVDFDKSVDYWLQDKWSGQFPVKWHIIKDVPNSQFRHIILEKNDNKPVTNSRDTQEVELEQGIEMLNIFKNYESYSSILDDFHFYEQRQKAMQERKAGQQANRVAPPSLAVGGEKQNQVSLSNDFIKTMSKSFAEAVLLTEHQKEHSSVRNVVSTAAVAHGDLAGKF
ncbi:hypothetical protein AB3S75_038271 [Citrus x aurantiifolia]